MRNLNRTSLPEGRTAIGEGCLCADRRLCDFEMRAEFRNECEDSATGGCNQRGRTDRFSGVSDRATWPPRARTNSPGGGLRLKAIAGSAHRLSHIGAEPVAAVRERRGGCSIVTRVACSVWAVHRASLYYVLDYRTKQALMVIVSSAPDRTGLQRPVRSTAALAFS